VTLSKSGKTLTREFPFPVTIEPVSSGKGPQTIMCVGLLRALDGKRKVLDAIWGQQPVILKVFTDPIKAKYHVARDWRGLELLQERNVNSPKPFFYGTTQQGFWAIVTEKIADALDVREIWDNTPDLVAKRQLLCRVSRELARQHSKGVLQRDLHLGNFLLQKDKLFAVDPAQMRFLSRAVGKNQAIAQLALLASFVPEEDEGTIRSVCDEYLKARSWEFTPGETAALWRKTAACRKNGIKYTLKKCIRTSKRFQRIRIHNFCGVAGRDFCERADFSKFLQSIEELIQNGKILKRGNTCFVARVSWAGQEIVVKKYNHKGIIHSVRHTIKKSRARRSWLHAHRLRALNIATPRPLAYFEQRKGILVWRSYFVTKYVQGQNLHHFLRDSKTSQRGRLKLALELKQLIGKLAKYRITHGDLKDSNILVTNDGPVLTDLDAVVAYKWNWAYKAMRPKDLDLPTRCGLSHRPEPTEGSSR
jgi:tRNA A-37 threonylcarbamoyl transferase component Bud32